MKKSFFKNLFLSAMVLSAGFVVSSCGDDDEDPVAGIVKRDVTVGYTMNLGLGSYASNDTYVGVVENVAGVGQVFTALHPGEVTIAGNNECQYHFTVTSAVANPFGTISTAWGSSFDAILKSLQLTEGMEGVDKANGKIVVESGKDASKITYTYIFIKDTYQRLEIAFNLAAIDKNETAAKNTILKYMSTNFNYDPTGYDEETGTAVWAQGIYGRCFNQATLDKANTVFQIVNAPEGSEYALVANYCNARTI